MQRTPVVLWLITLVLVLSACGGGDATQSAPTPTPSATPRNTPIELIPTWTPVPTHTPPPPRPTIDIDYARATNTPFSGISGMTNTPVPTNPPASNAPATRVLTAAPTVAPTLAVQLAGPPNPTLTITAETLNAALAEAFAEEVGQTLAAAPSVRMANSQFIVEARVIATPGGVVTQTPVTMRLNVLQVQGKPTLTVAEARVVDTNDPYEGDLTGSYLARIGEVLIATVDAQYYAVRPDDAGYFIATITVNDTVLSVQTVSLLQ